MFSLGEIQFESTVRDVLGGLVRLDELHAAVVTRDNVGPCEPTWAVVASNPRYAGFRLYILAHSEWGANDLIRQIRLAVRARGCEEC